MAKKKAVRKIQTKSSHATGPLILCSLFAGLITPKNHFRMRSVSGRGGRMTQCNITGE
jgi:hypothetical protein